MKQKKIESILSQSSYQLYEEARIVGKSKLSKTFTYLAVSADKGNNEAAMMLYHYYFLYDYDQCNLIKYKDLYREEKGFFCANLFGLVYADEIKLNLSRSIQSPVQNHFRQIREKYRYSFSFDMRYLPEEEKRKFLLHAEEYFTEIAESNSPQKADAKTILGHIRLATIQTNPLDIYERNFNLSEIETNPKNKKYQEIIYAISLYHESAKMNSLIGCSSIYLSSLDPNSKNEHLKYLLVGTIKGFFDCMKYYTDVIDERRMNIALEKLMEYDARIEIQKLRIKELESQLDLR